MCVHSKLYEEHTDFLDECLPANAYQTDSESDSYGDSYSDNDRGSEDNIAYNGDEDRDCGANSLVVVVQERGVEASYFPVYDNRYVCYLYDSVSRSLTKDPDDRDYEITFDKRGNPTVMIVEQYGIPISFFCHSCKKFTKTVISRGDFLGSAALASIPCTCEW
jgi:hypothetical protein